MWDEDIRREYGIRGSATGYLEFLKKMKEKLGKALEEEAKRTVKSKREIAKEFVRNFQARSLVEDIIERRWLNSSMNIIGGLFTVQNNSKRKNTIALEAISVKEA